MKIRIKIPKRVQLQSVLLLVALISICSFALLEHVSVSIPAFSTIKFPLLYVGGICIVTQANLLVKSFRKKKYFFVLLAVVAFCGALLLCAMANRNPQIGINPLRTTLRLMLFLLELFALSVWISETGKLRYVLNFLFWYVLIMVVVTDILFFTRLMVFHSGKFENYLIGTKFSVAYAHMYLVTLWFMRNNMRLFNGGHPKRFLIFAILIILAVSVRIDCMTGAIGCLLLLFCLMMLNTRGKKRFTKLSSPVILMLVLAASVLFPFIAERIVAIPFVSHIVENILGRDVTMTGRLVIFRLYGSQMQGHWLWGFGYGNGNLAAEQLFQCANAQNALLQWVLQSGIPVTALLIAVMMMIFSQLSKSPRQNQAMPLVMLIYVFCVMGMVETTFNMCFFMWLALIFVCVNERERADTHN